MHAWITDRPSNKKRKKRIHEESPRLELPLEQPAVQPEERRDTKGEQEHSQRGVAEVDFYI